jgi:hypothetical protein
MSRRQVNYFIGGNANQFLKALDDTEKGLQRVSRSAARAGRQMSTMFTAPLLAAGGALVATTIQAASYANEIDKMSQRTGIAASQLEELRYVADQLGVSFSSVESGIDAFRRRLGQFEGGTSEAAMAAEKLGINVRDSAGNMRSMNDLFPDVLARLRMISNETERSYMAIQLFGRGASQLTPLLKASSTQVAELSARAHELGLVMDDAAREDLVAFHDAMGELRMQAAATGREFAGVLLPLLRDELFPFIQNNVIPAVRDFAREFAELDDEGKKQVLMYAAIVAGAGPALVMFSHLTIVVQGLTASVRILTAALLANPFTAAAVGVATVTSALYIMSRRALEARDALVEAQRAAMFGEVDGTQETAMRLGRNIAENRQEFGLGAERGQERLDQLEAEYQELTRLLRLNSELMMLGKAQAGTAQDNTAAVQSSIKAYQDLKPAIEMALDPDKFTDTTQSLYEITGILLEIDRLDLSLAEKIAPSTLPGSVGAIRAQITQLNNEIEFMSDPERIQTLQGSIADLEMQMQYLLGTTEELSMGMEIMQPVVDNFVNSFGAGMANVVVQGEKLVDVLNNIGRLLASAAIQKGISLLLSGGLSSAGTGFFGSGGGLMGALLGGITGGTNVNDALITSSGQVFHLHPQDNILAFKGDQPMHSGGGTRVLHIRIPLEVNGKKIFEAIRDYEVSL